MLLAAMSRLRSARVGIWPMKGSDSSENDEDQHEAAADHDWFRPGRPQPGETRRKPGTPAGVRRGLGKTNAHRDQMTRR